MILGMQVKLIPKEIGDKWYWVAVQSFVDSEFYNDEGSLIDINYESDTKEGLIDEG